MRAVPSTFDSQVAIAEELLREVTRMEEGERLHAKAPATSRYERELRFAGLAQRIAQAYTVMEGVLGYVARRVDRAPVAGEHWHKALIDRCATPFEKPARPAVLSPALAGELRELCEFRHVVRNIYPTRLETAKVRENLRRLAAAARQFAEEIQAFHARR